MISLLYMCFVCSLQALAPLKADGTPTSTLRSTGGLGEIKMAGGMGGSMGGGMGGSMSGGMGGGIGGGTMGSTIGGTMGGTIDRTLSGTIGGPIGGTLERTISGPVGGGIGRGNGLGPLRGSGGEPIINTSTGLRLSNEGPMRSSAEAYLRGSTDVSAI